MKSIILNIFAIIIPVVFFSLNTAGAGERVRVFEMGESGLTIEFPMTTDEMAAQDAAHDQVIAASKKSGAGPNNQEIVFEMGEGGQTVAFPMTAEEITAANAEIARLSALKAARASKTQQRVVRYELAESGHIIEFQASKTENETDDLMISGDI